MSGAGKSLVEVNALALTARGVNRSDQILMGSDSSELFCPRMKINHFFAEDEQLTIRTLQENYLLYVIVLF